MNNSYYNPHSYLATMVPTGETVLWSAKPAFYCFILESIFNPLLPFALIWALIDFAFIFNIFKAGAPTEVRYFVIPFFALHLMPVWIYLIGVITSWLKYKHTEFIITDKAVYISGGTFGVNYKSKPFREIKTIDIIRGMIDQMQGVGDVVINESEYSSNYRRNNLKEIFRFEICDVPDYQNVYNMLRGLVDAENSGNAADYINNSYTEPEFANPENNDNDRRVDW